ncbi:hypothetical protein Tco_1468185 [Tanacetum coccineum]
MAPSLTPSATESEKTLLLSFREVNTDSNTDKRPKYKKQVTETQHDEEPVATTNTTKGLDASESTEEVANLPLTAATEKEHETIVDENIEDLLAIDSSIRSLGNVDLDQVMKEQKDFGDSENELSAADEIVTDKVIDELISKANTKDTHTIISAACAQEKKNIPRAKLPHVQSLGAILRFKEIQITKAPGLNPLGHFPRRMDFLATYVHNLGKSLPNSFDDKLKSAAFVVPRMIYNALEQ